MFRFMLVEDTYLPAAAQWVKESLPGASFPPEYLESLRGSISPTAIQQLAKGERNCEVEVHDCIATAWRQIRDDSRPFDGLILDMDVSLHPQSSQGVEINLSDLPPSLGGREQIPTGGLWLWAAAIQRYGRNIPTVFFTGHGHRYSEFLEPLEWANQAFWSNKKLAGKLDAGSPASARSESSGTIPETGGNWRESVNHILRMIVRDRTWAPGEIIAEVNAGKWGVDILSALLRLAMREVPTDAEAAALDEFAKKFSSLRERLDGKHSRETVSASHWHEPLGIFHRFMDGVRRPLLRERFFDRAAEYVVAARPDGFWTRLAAAPEQWGWRMPELFPEYDFSAEAAVGQKHLTRLQEQLYSQSQIDRLNAIFSGYRSPLNWVTHTNLPNWDERRRRNIDLQDILAQLRDDVRAHAEKEILAIQQYAAEPDAKEHALAFRDWLRDPQSEWYIPESVRSEIAGLFNLVRDDYDGRMEDLGEWRMRMIGQTDGRSVATLQNDIDQRLRESGGALSRLANTCRGFFMLLYRVHPVSPEDTVLVRNLLETYGDWWEEKDAFSATTLSHGNLVTLELQPMNF